MLETLVEADKPILQRNREVILVELKINKENYSSSSAQGQLTVENCKEMLALQMHNAFDALVNHPSLLAVEMRHFNPTLKKQDAFLA